MNIQSDYCSSSTFLAFLLQCFSAILVGNLLLSTCTIWNSINAFDTKQRTLLDFKVLQPTQNNISWFATQKPPHSHFGSINSIWIIQLNPKAKIQKFQSITQNWHSTAVFAIAMRAAVKISMSQSFSIRMSKNRLDKSIASIIVTFHFIFYRWKGIIETTSLWFKFRIKENLLNGSIMYPFLTLHLDLMKSYMRTYWKEHNMHKKRVKKVSSYIHHQLMFH